MRQHLPAFLGASVLGLAVSFGTPALAAGPDPSVDQIYQAVQAGNLGQAQTMIDEVLRDHPESWKAHFIQAELFAKEGKTAQARSELAKAEEIQPGLPKANPHSVDELKTQLGLMGRTASAPTHFNGGMAGSSVQEKHFPVWTVVVLVGAVLLLWMLFRRRPAAAYPMGASPAGGYGPGPGYGGAPMGPGGYGAPMGGGGIGSGIAGGLASGLAVGAGVVAGEELAHHFLDGGQRESGGISQSNDNAGWSGANNDSGGNDFGINDPGSWDDGSGGGGGGDSGGGGGDWS